jgi:putative ABC transport system permease protein
MSLRWLRFAWLNTLRNRRRSLVTIGIAALGTTGILLSAGFALYTYEALAEDAARTSGHLIVAQPAQFERDEDVPLQNGLSNVAKIKAQLLSDPDVRHVLPRVDFSGLIGNGDKSIVMIAAGIEPDSEFAVKGPFLTMKAGDVLASSQRNAVMLGEGLARNLKAQPGSTLTLLVSTTEGALNALDVTVQGVFTSGIAEIDRRLLYTDLVTAQKLLVTDKVSSMGVFLARMNQTTAAKARIEAMLPNLKVRTWLQQAQYYRSVRELYDRIFGALGMVIGVIVVFVVTNAMAMAVVERTREIGTLRALGTLPGQLTRSFALEGMVLGGLGTAIGAAAAIGISIALLFVDIQMPAPPGRSDPYPLNISLDPTLYLATVLAMVLLSMGAAALVARRTVAQPIVDALARA